MVTSYVCMKEFTKCFTCFCLLCGKRKAASRLCPYTLPPCYFWVHRTDTRNHPLLLLPRPFSKLQILRETTRCFPSTQYSSPPLPVLIATHSKLFYSILLQKSTYLFSSPNQKVFIYPSLCSMYFVLPIHCPKSPSLRYQLLSFPHLCFFFFEIVCL